MKAGDANRLPGVADRSADVRTYSAVDVAGNLRTIEARLRELGDAPAADRLDAALAGSTSGEILAGAGAELGALVAAGYAADPVIGRLLRDTRDELDAINHNPRPGAVLRRVRRALRRRFER